MPVLDTLLREYNSGRTGSYYTKLTSYNQNFLRFLAMQKLAEEKKAEALKHMNSLPQVELDLKRHGPDGYHHGGCREPRGMSQSSNMTRHQHPKQVGGGESIVFIRLTLEPAGSPANVFYQQPLNWLLLCLVSRY